MPSDSFSATRFSNRVAFVFVRTLGEVGRFPPMSFPPPGEEVDARTATGPHLPIRLLLDDGLVPLLAPGAAITLADASPFDAPVTMVSVSSSHNWKCVHEEDLPKILLPAGFFLDFSKVCSREAEASERASGRAPTSREAGTHASRGWLEGKRDSRGIGEGRAWRGENKTKRFCILFCIAEG